jgi:RNA polymerase sigma factor (sigma-70 family)
MTTAQSEWLAHRFEEQRARLRAVGYRMLGSLSEADDAVQETWLRLSRSETHTIENLGGWLTTVVARVCLDMLRARKLRGEQPLGVRVPDPIVSREGHIDPEHEMLLADSVGLALLAVLETLPPAERLAFVLHDMFDVPFEEIAPIVGARRRRHGSSPAAGADGYRGQRLCRTSVSRDSDK